MAAIYEYGLLNLCYTFLNLTLLLGILSSHFPLNMQMHVAFVSLSYVNSDEFLCKHRCHKVASVVRRCKFHCRICILPQLLVILQCDWLICRFR